MVAHRTDRPGRLKDAKAAWRKALDAGPPEHDAWFGYAELCLFLGDENEYRRARRTLLVRFGRSTDPAVAERTARACLLLPGTKDETEDAAALANRAVAAGRSGANGPIPTTCSPRAWRSIAWGGWTKRLP